MNKTPNKDQVQSYLASYGMAPIRRLGQNFLIDNDVARTIVNSLDIEDTDIVAEIGAGFGALTCHLVSTKARLQLFELDAKMCQFLNDQYGNNNLVTISHLDVLKASLIPYTIIVSNLPYYATTVIIEKIYREASELKRATFMIQKDVYPRISALVGQDGYGPLAIILNYIADISAIVDVKPSSFFPIPPVDSLVISLNIKPAVDRDFALKMDRMVRHLFQNRRKTILNNLTSLVASKEVAKTTLKQVGIPENYRPENVAIDQYVALVKALNK